jgi:DNA-binding CsgD family transcriptional regulator
MWTGQWASAQADATEALRWAEELGQRTSAGSALVCLARIHAARGERATCEDIVVRSRTRCGQYGIDVTETYHTAVLGLAAVTHGDHLAAIDHLEATHERATRQGLSNPVVIPYAADLAEAHLHTGNRRRATEILDDLERKADQTGLAWPAAAAARCRGMLATSRDEANVAFDAAAAAHRRLPLPFEHARMLLCRGEVLRRLHHPSAARQPLGQALGIFQNLGAQPWATRASTELAAAGQRPTAAPTRDALDQLTAQELQIARAIANGLSTAEAAATLFLSRKTVEAHLTRVYRKLGIRSRAGIARALAAHGITD